MNDHILPKTLPLWRVHISSITALSVWVQNASGNFCTPTGNMYSNQSLYSADSVPNVVKRSNIALLRATGALKGLTEEMQFH